MVSGCPDVGDVLAVFLARFVIEELVVDDVAASLEAGHDAGVGRDAVAVFPCLEGLDEDGVVVAVVGHHQVLVAAAGEDWEASCVVCVERADGFYPYVELYIDDTGHFPIRSRSGNQYLIFAYHCDTNAMLIDPFQIREDRYRIPAYTRIMTRLKTRGHVIDHQVLDNEASKEYRQHVTDIWAATYQLVPP